MESMNRSSSFGIAAVLLAAVTAGAVTAPAEEPPKTVQKSQSFDRDPGWEGHNNRLLPRELPTITQEFGYSKTGFAGKAAGEMGGLVTRASEPAYYADRIGPKTLDDRLSASGSLALKKTTPAGGVFFGFFRAAQPGGGGRPICSLGMNLDTEHTGGRLAVRLITGRNQSCGTFITPFIPGKFRPTPLRNDGPRYTWKLDYDPEAAGGRGRFTFTLHGEAPKPEEIDTPDLPEAFKQEARVRFPTTTSFSVDLPEGYRNQGTTFDHFGLMNMMKPGGQVTLYFADLTYDGRSQDFSRDPGWDASRNQGTYQATDVSGAHNFGFSNSSHAGGKPGEAGGVFWRADTWGYYADRVGPLSFEDRLEARGRVVLAAGGPDSDMCFGWFRSPESGDSPFRVGSFLGIKVGGPTRVGHYFLPALVADEQVRVLPDRGPVMEPGRAYQWSVVYDPEGNNGQGTIAAKLGDQSITAPLRPGQKARAKAARLDRFGMLSIGPGGQIVRLYLDDLAYTTRAK